jgi:zinc protease
MTDPGEKAASGERRAARSRTSSGAAVRRFALDNGAVVLTEHSAVLPVVSVGVSLRTGSLFDPDGQEGLMRMLGRAMRMGTAKLGSRKLEETVDSLGAQLSISCSQSYVHFAGVVVAHNLEPFLALLAELVQRPALRPADVSHVRRELIAELSALCDDDRGLCARHFRRYAFGEHPYGRPRSGTRASLRRIGLEDLRRHHQRHVTAQNAVLDVSGDFAPGTIAALLEKHFGSLGSRPAPSSSVPALRFARGRRVLCIDKPKRTQTQVLIGTLGTSPHDADHVPLVVANTAFGGLFSSRLNDEVRSKRGLSYGASSGFTLSRTRDLWSMHTFPAAKDALACIELQLELFARWVQRGVSARELSAVQRYLEKSHAFEIDTAAKRLDQRLDLELLGWPTTHYSRFIPRVKAVTRDDIAKALAQRLSLEDQAIVLVATADELVPQLEKLPNVTTVDVVAFDDI